jgi:hypothetical protein
MHNIYLYIYIYESITVSSGVRRRGYDGAPRSSRTLAVAVAKTRDVEVAVGVGVYIHEAAAAGTTGSGCGSEDVDEAVLQLSGSLTELTTCQFMFLLRRGRRSHLPPEYMGVFKRTRSYMLANVADLSVMKAHSFAKHTVTTPRAKVTKRVTFQRAQTKRIKIIQQIRPHLRCYWNWCSSVLPP